MMILVILVMGTCVLQDIALEAAIPRSAIYRMEDIYVKNNESMMSLLESGRQYSEGLGWCFTAGSRAEGLTLQKGWGHQHADVDLMIVSGGALGVRVAGAQQPREAPCLDFRPENCPPAYCKLEVSNLHGLRESTVMGKPWFAASCVEESDRAKWLNTHNTVREMKNSESAMRFKPVSGPAIEFGIIDVVQSLVCSGPHPNLNEFSRRARGPWPPRALINYLLHLPMLLVLVGHKLSPEITLQARISWSHAEYILINELPESVRQGFIACKYVMQRFLKAHRDQNEAIDGRSHIGSYHIKTVFLRFLEKRSPSLITSAFGLFLDLFREMDEYLKVGKLPHYFLADCDLLEMVGDDERHLARRVIREIFSDPLNALLSSPSRPQEIYGEVRPDDLVVAFCKTSAHLTRGQYRNLSELLTRVDERRRQRYREQSEVDRTWPVVSGRAELTTLVDMLKRIEHI